MFHCSDTVSLRSVFLQAAWGQLAWGRRLTGDLG
jgi:hypothetical protein